MNENLEGQDVEVDTTTSLRSKYSTDCFVLKTASLCSSCHFSFKMSIVHALADLQTWPGQSKLHFGVLEDTIENVFSLMKVNSEPKTF